MARKTLKQAKKELARNTPRNLDMTDRFRAYYLQNIELKVSEKETLAKLRFAWSNYSNYPSKQETITILATEYELSDSQAYAILKQAIKLFGDVLHTDKQGERLASYEYYMSLSRSAKTAGEYDVAMKCKEKADKIMGLLEPDKTPIDPAKMMPAAVIVFNSDPKILQTLQKKESETIDISHEED